MTNYTDNEIDEINYRNAVAHARAEREYHREEQRGVAFRFFLGMAMVVAVLVGLMSLGGCAAVATSNDAIMSESTGSIQSKLVVGKTTKADVAGMFGAPSSRSAMGDGEMWTYYSFAGSTLRGLGIGNSNSLAVWFDTAGVLRNYQAS